MIKKALSVMRTVSPFLNALLSWGLFLFVSPFILLFSIKSGEPVSEIMGWLPFYSLFAVGILCLFFQIRGLVLIINKEPLDYKVNSFIHAPAIGVVCLFFLLILCSFVIEGL